MKEVHHLYIADELQMESTLCHNLIVYKRTMLLKGGATAETVTLS